MEGKLERQAPYLWSCGTVDPRFRNDPANLWRVIRWDRTPSVQSQFQILNTSCDLWTQKNVFPLHLLRNTPFLNRPKKDLLRCCTVWDFFSVFKISQLFMVKGKTPTVLVWLFLVDEKNATKRFQIWDEIQDSLCCTVQEVSRWRTQSLSCSFISNYCPLLLCKDLLP